MTTLSLSFIARRTNPEDRSSSLTNIVLVPGNPGILHFYRPFVDGLFDHFKGQANVFAIGHLGQEAEIHAEEPIPEAAVKKLGSSFEELNPLQKQIIAKDTQLDLTLFSKCFIFFRTVVS
eukprot:m.25453 g.25453  ORF g.25453 m.25453 type:complete len:120 (+) comp28810_c0_seq1:16-375(+)